MPKPAFYRWQNKKGGKMKRRVWKQAVAGILAGMAQMTDGTSYTFGNDGECQA